MEDKLRTSASTLVAALLGLVPGAAATLDESGDDETVGSVGNCIGTALLFHSSDKLAVVPGGSDDGIRRSTQPWVELGYLDLQGGNDTKGYDYKLTGVTGNPNVSGCVFNQVCEELQAWLALLADLFTRDGYPNPGPPPKCEIPPVGAPDVA